MISSNIMKLMKNFINRGFEIYIIGGFVRDHICNRESSNINFITNADVNDIYKIVGGSRKPKDKYTVYGEMDGKHITITSYFTYINGYRTKTHNLNSYLSHIDFTIDSIMMDMNGIIIDKFNGIHDLKSKVLRSIGNPDDRIKESRIRLLRSVRIASQYNLSIDKELMFTLKNNYSEINKVNVDIIRGEFNKIILSYNPKKWINLLANLNILQQIIPEISETIGFKQFRPNHDKTIFQHLTSTMEHIEPKLELRLAAMLHDIGKPKVFRLDSRCIGHFDGHHMVSQELAKTIMTRLGYNKTIIDHVSTLVYYHMSRYDFLRETSLCKFINNVGVDKINDLFNLQLADIISGKTPYKLDKLYKLRFDCQRLISSGDMPSINKLPITNKDIIKLGIYGSQVDDALNYALRLTIDSDCKKISKSHLLNQICLKFKK